MAASGHVHFEQNAAASTGPGPGRNDSTIDSSVRHENLIGKQKVDENEVLHEQNKDSEVGQHGPGSSTSTGDANSPDAMPHVPTARGSAHPPKNKQSYASLFQNNRVPNEASKFTYIAPPLGKVVLGIDEIDSVESAFGFCLIGYVMGPRPSPYALLNYVKGWGNEVKFTFKENGWIRFQFPSAEVRDRVLNGGPYMIFGRQLFLKKLPSCFMFSKEDMEFFPSWVRIFGLPVDCWTTKALSKIASVVGKPLHTDLLTISKKGATYARILVELDAKKPRVREYSVELPTGKVILIKFKYEFGPKFCEKCGCLGHSVETCGTEHARGRRKLPPRQPETDHNHTVGHSEASGSKDPTGSNANEPVTSEAIPDITEPVKLSYAAQAESGDQDVDAQPSDKMPMTADPVTSPLHSDEHLLMDSLPLEHHEPHIPEGRRYTGFYMSEEENSCDDSGMHSTHTVDFDGDNDDLLDILSRVITQDKG